jgi:hypothetical protein
MNKGNAMSFGRTACFSVGAVNHRMALRQRVMRACIGPLVLALAQISVVHPARAGGRVAMVLVAEDYEPLNRSLVGIKQGSEIAEQLRARGFDVIFKDNPTNATARAALHIFYAKVSGTDLSLAILIGHGTASGDQTFFLPTNAAIERPTDLRTRGLSIANIANIVSQAGVGGVCFLMTSPRFANPIDGIDMRPHFDVEVAKTTVAAFSNSAKVPVSAIDTVAELAVKEIVDLLQKQQHADLRQFVAACASQQGTVYGLPATVDLAAPVTVTPATQGKDELVRQLEAEIEAREAAEKQASEAEERAAQAEATEVEERARRQAEAKTNTPLSPPATAQAPNGPLGGRMVSIVDAPAGSLPGPPIGAPPSPTEAAQAWAMVKDTTSIPVLETFIKRSRDGFYADIARARLDELKQQQPAAPQRQTEVANDEVENVRRYRMAAEAGNKDAMNNLGFMFADGRGVAKDDVEAVRWYRRAAEAGNAFAMGNLGFMYQEGRGIARDDVEAVRWYRKAVEAGNAFAMGNLGFMYAEGRGIAKDDVEAVRWYRKAVEAGDGLAMHNLGFMYLNGRGVSKDSRNAAVWVFKALQVGNKFSYEQITTHSDTWSIEFRRELQQLLANARVYNGPIDGKFSPAVKLALDKILPEEARAKVDADR